MKSDGETPGAETGTQREGTGMEAQEETKMEWQIGELAEQIVEILKLRDWHISFAESCTGGLAAARLVDVASASAVFDGSFVTYANEAKVKLLGVREETIQSVGVVSEEVAGQMARRAAAHMAAEVGVGITGVAGPTGGTPRKPVGMVCFGFFVNGTVQTFTKQFGNLGRNAVRAASVAFVYETLWKLLAEQEGE